MSRTEVSDTAQEYLPLIRERLIDYIRVHMSDIGGLTPMRKLASLCEFFGVRCAAGRKTHRRSRADSAGRKTHRRPRAESAEALRLTTAALRRAASRCTGRATARRSG